MSNQTCYVLNTNTIIISDNLKKACKCASYDRIFFIFFIRNPATAPFSEISSFVNSVGFSEILVTIHSRF